VSESEQAATETPAEVVERPPLVALGANVEWPDSEASTSVTERLAADAGYGRLAELAAWAVGVRAPAATGSFFDRVRAIVVGAEPDPLVLDTATAAGVDVRRVATEDGDVAAGAAIADDEVDRGTDLLVLAVPGPHSEAADAAIVISVLTNTEPVKVLARGADATDPEAWMSLAVDVRDRRRPCLQHRNHPDRMLAEIGSPRLAVAAGIALAAAARRTPVLLDGPVAVAAALLGYEAQPRAGRWWAVADLSSNPMQEVALARLGQRAVLGLGAGRGDGLAGLLAVPVIRAALRIGLDARPG
jgi:nicotinate-nucleotide--dimethylbenzimidazole phosphoribosyltransferase